MLDPVAHDVRSRMFGLAFWVVLPLIAVVTVVQAVQDYSAHVNRRPPGTSGTFLVTNRTCFGNVCQTAGTFVSDDGTLTEPNLLGDYRWKVGGRYRTAYQAGTGIIALAARWDPTGDVLGIAGGSVFLGMWAFFLLTWLVRLRRRRRPQPARTAATRSAR